jgi:non-ribosomal peptide synthetase component F/acyl carrier protein
VPSVLRMLVDEPDWSGCTALRLVFSAGEPLHAELCQRLLKHVAVEIWNTYGPTECAIDATAQPFDPAQRSGPVPIGRPIDGARILVLDPAGRPVPIGVPGELHIGGAGVGRGYLGQPRLTADRFGPDPFGPPGSRIYRTGDLVHWRSDGTLAYLGRLDNQVKINGVRVEPGEIEAALMRHPDIGSAVVTAHAGPTGATRLVAYVLRRDVAQPESLRSYLSRRLPGPLVPADYVALDAFPTTTSGKIDRAALPAPDPLDSAHRPSFRPPGAPLESLVAQVWSELLGVTDIGLDDNFFQLGGSSLLITKLATRLGAATGRELAVADLFFALTVRAQARLLDVDPPDEAPIRPARRDGDLPLSSGQLRQWFLDKLQPGVVQWVAPMVVELPAATTAATAQRALDAVQARHEALRTRYVLSSAGDPVQVVDPPGRVPLRLAGPGGDLATLFGEEFARGFDLEHEAPVRALLVNEPDRPVLLVTMHHIASDGWSTVILERELIELCTAENAGRAAELPTPTVQYADYAAWQQARLTDARLAPHLTYWRAALDGLATLDLPFDRPRPPVFDIRGALAPFKLDADLADRATALGRRHGATPFMTFLTVYAILLSRYSGRSDLAVGVPVSGRIHPDVAGTVGFFLNSLVLRCDLTGAPSFGVVLDRIRDASLGAFAHQSLPFERLVDELVDRRDLARTPLYQVEFDMHDEGLTATAADTEAMDAFQRAWTVAKTDLCLYLQRNADGSMVGTVEYPTALFDPATVEAFVQHYTRLLEAVTAEPDQPVSAVDYLSPGERRALADDRRAPAADTDLLVPGHRFTGLPPGDAGGPVRVDVVDPAGQLVPVGVPGELRLAGPMVGPATVCGQDLPTDRFAPDPVGGWLFHTGELVRRRPDGSVEALGRVAHPVRIRGMWVDPRPAEAALTAHPDVAEAVVDADGDTLTAYWAGAGPVEPSPEALAEHCQARLGAHEVPGAFVRVAAVPHTADEMVALRTGGLAVGTVAEGRGPLSLAEQRVAHLWAELLELSADDIAVDAGFFAAGGNSILAIRLIAILRDEFGVDVPVRMLFEEGTVATVAAEVEAQISAEVASLPDAAVLAELLLPDDAVPTGPPGRH